MAKNESPAVAGITEDLVKQLIVTALDAHSASLATMIEGIVTETVDKVMAAHLAGFLTKEELQALGLATVEQVKDMFNEAFSGMIESDVLKPIVGISTVSVTGELPPLDPAWLAGLKFAGSRKKEGKAGERAVHVPFERDLSPDDVLSYSLSPGLVNLVAADGKKHQVRI